MESNTLEEVVNLTIAAGVNSGRIDITPEAGQIVRAVIYRSDLNNPGIVNAAIVEDGTGKEISKPQHIDNYRSRDSSYLDGKPLYHKGGRKLWFIVTADENFTSEFTAQLILIKLDPGVVNDNCS